MRPVFAGGSLTVSIICIAIATAWSILANWGVVESSTLMWRTLATLGVLFVASLFTVNANGIFTDRGRHQARLTGAGD